MSRTTAVSEVTTRIVRYGSSQVRVREIHRPEHASDRAFVLVHGIGVSSRYFEPLAVRLAEHGDVYLLDLPGFGGIPKPHHTLSIPGFAEAVRACLLAEHIDNPVLIGHSMGAQVVTELLAEHPATSDEAVLIGPPVNPLEQTVRRQLWRLLQSSVAESPRIRLIATRAYVACGLSWFVEVLPGMMRYPMTERLPLVRAHTLVLRGEHDLVAPSPWIEQVVDLLPDARAEEVPGAAHAVVYEHDAEVADAVARHLGA